MALEDLDFADGWSRLLSLIRPEPGKFAIYLLLKVLLAIVAAILFGIITILPIILLVLPAVLAVFAGYKAGLGWNVGTVSVAIIGGSVLLSLLLYLVSLVNVPGVVFFPAFAIYFFAARYPKLEALLHPALPLPPAPPAPEFPPPFEAPPSAASSAEPIG
jgi:hypothetical protein